MVTLLSAPMAQALTTNEIVGAWDAAIVVTNHVRVFGDVSWKSVAFASNRVSWAWMREGKAENHKGTFVIVPEVPAKAGMYRAYRIEINPTTLALPGLIVLMDVRHDLDNRFPYGTKVLKFKDEEGYWHVFRRKPE